MSNTLSVKDLQVALCLQRRKDICSALKPSVIGEYSLHTTMSETWCH